MLTWPLLAPARLVLADLCRLGADPQLLLLRNGHARAPDLSSIVPFFPSLFKCRCCCFCCPMVSSSSRSRLGLFVSSWLCPLHSVSPSHMTHLFPTDRHSVCSCTSHHPCLRAETLANSPRPFRSSLVRFRSCLFVVGGLVSSN